MFGKILDCSIQHHISMFCIKPKVLPDTFVDVITIIVPTLAASCWMLKEQQQQGHPQKDCVGLLLALLRIVHLYGPNYLNATDTGTGVNDKKFGRNSKST